MDSKDKEILNKLVKIATAQQRIINKLAQNQTQEPGPGSTTPEDKMAVYLKKVFTIACSNNGVNLTVPPKVEHKAGTTDGNIKMGGTYSITATGVPANLRQKVLTEYQATVHKQDHQEFFKDKSLDVIFV